MHKFINPDTENVAVHERRLEDSLGNSLELECSIETLMLLENLFSKTVGTHDSHPALCYWLRDVFEPETKSSDRRTVCRPPVARDDLGHTAWLLRLSVAAL